MLFVRQSSTATDDITTVQNIIVHIKFSTFEKDVDFNLKNHALIIINTSTATIDKCSYKSMQSS